VKAAHHPSRLKTIIRGSMGLDRDDQNPMALDRWTAAPVPFAAQPDYRGPVAQSAFQTPAEPRVDGLQFATPQAAWLYGPAGRGEAPPDGVAILGTGNPVGDAQARMIRAHLMGVALNQIASIG